MCNCAFPNAMLSSRLALGAQDFLFVIRHSCMLDMQHGRGQRLFNADVWSSHPIDTLGAWRSGHPVRHSSFVRASFGRSCVNMRFAVAFSRVRSLPGKPTSAHPGALCPSELCRRRHGRRASGQFDRAGLRRYGSHSVPGRGDTQSLGWCVDCRIPSALHSGTGFRVEGASGLDISGPSVPGIVPGPSHHRPVDGDAQFATTSVDRPPRPQWRR